MRGKCSSYTSVDCQERKFPVSEKSPMWNDSKNHCSLQDEDSHGVSDPVDHESLLGCHRDDENEDECVVEER